MLTAEEILVAAEDVLRRHGPAKANVVDVARTLGVSHGSVYRHFPSKADLLTEVFRVASQREVDAVGAATAGDAPAPRRIAAAVAVFARRALRGRRLAWALLAEPVDPLVDAERLAYRRRYAELVARELRAAVEAGEIPPQDVSFTAAALVGGCGEALVGPLSSVADAEDVVAFMRTFIRRGIGAA